VVGDEEEFEDDDDDDEATSDQAVNAHESFVSTQKMHEDDEVESKEDSHEVGRIASRLVAALD
jgi:hypothetical protein